MDPTVTGYCRSGDHKHCRMVLTGATGWNWWCTCHCHPAPTLADAAPNSGAEHAIVFWHAHREKAAV